MKRNKKGSLFTLLLRNYIIFTIVVIIVFIIAIFLAFFGNQLNLVDYSQIAEYDELLQKQQYDQFPTTRLLGENSSIIILNQDNQPIYNSGSNQVDLFNEDIIFIPDAIANYYMSATTLTTHDNSTVYELTITYDNGNQDILILDSMYQIIYSTKDVAGRQLTEKQYRLLTNQYYPDYLLYKYCFTTEYGEENTLLLLRYANQDLIELQKIGKMFTQAFIYFTLFYILLIFIFILWLKKKINKPLNILCQTFEDYSVGETIQKKYQGPKEFMNIFDHFSSMVDRLNQSEKQRKELEDNKRKMIANIVHDFKTPIAVIKGYTQAIADGLVKDDKQSQYLSIINNKSTQLNDLILNLYEYSKMDHPDFQLNLNPIDVCVYFRNFVAQSYTEWELAGFQIEVDIPDVHCVVSMDTNLMNHVFANIIGNAIDHNDKGRTLYFGMDILDKEVVLLLGDNGKGIPDEYVDTIFEPFVTGKSSRNDKGSGLGLSIAKKIVEMHQGSLQLTPSNQWKTLFQIRLPRN